MGERLCVSKLCTVYDVLDVFKIHKSNLWIVLFEFYRKGRLLAKTHLVLVDECILYFILGIGMSLSYD